MLEAHQTTAAPPGGCCVPDPIVGTVQYAVTAPRMWMIVGSRNTWEVCPDHREPMAPQQLRILEGTHHPDPWMILAPAVGKGTSEGLCDVFDRSQPTPHPDVMRGLRALGFTVSKDAPVMPHSPWQPT